MKERQDAAAFTVSQQPVSWSSSFRWVTSFVTADMLTQVVHKPSHATATLFPRTDTSHCVDKRGGGMWPKYGVWGPSPAV